MTLPAALSHPYYHNDDATREIFESLSQTSGVAACQAWWSTLMVWTSGNRGTGASRR